MNHLTHIGATNKPSQATSSLSLSVVPEDLQPLLEKAALQYAAMSPSEFSGQTLFVGSTRLRQVGLIDGPTWARVPANDRIKVTRQPNGELQALTLLAGV